ncbi:MAG: hypothetical protein JWP29_3539 [Rhodoferax sp.]|nr:hypothetical protein [Rhodoferax sp.]
MIAIGVPDQNDSLLEIDLEGETFFLHFAWNSEAEFWTLGVESASHDTLVEGVVIVPDTLLLSRYRQEGMPPGDLMVVVPDRRDSITRAALPAGDVTLLYASAAEIADAVI